MAFMIQNIQCHKLFVTLLGLNIDSDKMVLVCLGLIRCCVDPLKTLLHTASRATNPVMVLPGGKIGISSTDALSRE